MRSVAKIVREKKSEGISNSPKLDRIGFFTSQANKNRLPIITSILFSRDSLEVTNIETLFPELQSMCKPKDPISDNYHLPGRHQK